MSKMCVLIYTRCFIGNRFLWDKHTNIIQKKQIPHVIYLQT